jgi:hypothetical protein
MGCIANDRLSNSATAPLWLPKSVRCCDIRRQIPPVRLVHLSGKADQAEVLQERKKQIGADRLRKKWQKDPVVEILRGIIPGLATVCLIVNCVSAAPNEPPSIEMISWISALPGALTEPIPIQINDLETEPDRLKLSFAITPLAGNNTNLLSVDEIQLGGSGTNRFVSFSTRPDEYGSVRITFTVEDELGGRGSVVSDVSVDVFNVVGTIDFAPGDRFAWADVDNDGWLDWVGDKRWIRNAGGTNFVGAGSAVSVMTDANSVAFGDPDNDGYVDFAAVGTQSRAATTLVYTNGAADPPLAQRFQQLTNVLDPGFLSATITWQDYDLDGDVDLFAVGSTSRRGGDAIQGIVWRNDGSLAFTAVSGVVPAKLDAAMAWTDVNLDGAPDLLLLGTTNRSNGSTRLFLNSGSGTLEESTVELPPVMRGAAAWGDIDQDGRPDLFLAGLELTGNRYTNRVSLYRQTDDGKFVEAARFEPLTVTECFLADFNNDGLIDLIYHGIENDFAAHEHTKIYINRGSFVFQDASPGQPLYGEEIPNPLAIGDYDGDGVLDLAASRCYYKGTAWRTNKPPIPPSGLQAAVQGSAVLLSWNPATDSSQTNGLTYNVRVGRMPGGSEVLSPMSLPNGRRVVVDAGNAYQSLKKRLIALAPGQYFWTVQAIDASFASSSFAPEQKFSVGARDIRISSIRSTVEGLELVIDGADPEELLIEKSSDLASWTSVEAGVVTGNAVFKIERTNDDLWGFYRVRRKTIGQ